MTHQELEERLKKYWKTKDLVVIGKYSHNTGSKAAFFNELRNLNGDLLFFPEIKEIGLDFKLASAFTFPIEKLESEVYYRFKAEINRNDKYWSKNPLFIKPQPFELPTMGLRNRIKAEEHVRSIYDRKGESPDDAKNLANSLKQFQLELYTKPERFIFELLQNADDYPGDAEKLSVRFQALQENILFSHNGLAFRWEDVESLCDIGDSTKQKNNATTGYKGIGFKSVFTYASKVYVTSGDYRFSFDKNHEAYFDFDRMYPNKKKDPHYLSIKNDFEGPDKVPWQLKPLWREWYRYPDEVQVQEHWFKENVGICLDFGHQNVTEFENIVRGLLQEPRFMLFLKNIEVINIKTETGFANRLEVKRENDFVEIGEQQQKQRYLVRNSEPIDFENVKEQFKNVANIPPKILEGRSFIVSFAAKVKENEIIADEDTIIFAFLPTEDRSYNFPFIVNSDFVTSSSREQIQPENKWNIFIFEHIGYQLVCWLQNIATKYPEWRATYLRLLPKFFNKRGDIYDSFNAGYKKGLDEIPFLPAVNGTIIKVNEAIQDKTGVFTIIEPELLKNLPEFQDRILIDPELVDENHVLKSLGVFQFTLNDFVALFQNENVRQVLTQDVAQFGSILKAIYNLKTGKQLLVNLRDLPLFRNQNKLDASFHPLKLFKSNVPSEYRDTFESLGILMPVSDELDELLLKDEILREIFRDIFKLQSYSISSTINLLNLEKTKAFFTAAKSRSHTTEEIRQVATKMWYYLFENRDFKKNGQLQVDSRFMDAIIPDENGNLLCLQECKVERKNDLEDKSSYLYEKFGNRKHNLLSFKKLGFDEQQEEELISFFKSIHPEIEITRYQLFKETLDNLAQDTFKQLFESSIETVVNAGIDFFNIYQEAKHGFKDIHMLFEFPVVTRERKIVPAKNVYLGHDYLPIAPGTDFFAEELFEGVENISFLSIDYLREVSENKYSDLFQFLTVLDIRPDFKIYKSVQFKEGYHVNIANIDKGAFANSVFNSRISTSSDFSVIRHMPLLSDRIVNLEVFWKKIKKVWKDHNFCEKIYINGYKNITPFIYLLREYNLVPVTDGVISSKKLYAPFLTKKFPLLNKAVIDLADYPGLADNIFFEVKISIPDIVEILRNDNLDYELYRELITDHLLKHNLDFSENCEKLQELKLRNSMGSSKLCRDLIYFDDSLAETALINLLTPKSKLSEKRIDDLGLGIEVKDFFSKVGVTILTCKNITVQFYPCEVNGVNREEIIALFEEYGCVLNQNKDSNSKLNSISELKFIQCESIVLSFDLLSSYTQEVSYFIDENNVYFKNKRDVIEAISSQITGVNDHIKREIERKLSGNEDSGENPHIESTQEIEYSEQQLLALNRLYMGNLPPNYQKNYNLAALVSGLVELESRGYDVDKAYDSLKNTHIFSQIDPVILNGEHFTVMCRSAHKGLLYLTAQAWNRLDYADVKLYIDLGKGANHLCFDKKDTLAITAEDVEYQILRVESDSSLENIEDLLDGNFDKDKIWLIFKVKTNTVYDPIFFKRIKPDNESLSEPPINRSDEELGY